MSLLFAERPLVINTQLAMKIGLNEAIVLQQLHYWLRDTNSGMECDGVRWIYNTTEQWLEQFPFWSESTLKRAFASLKTLGLLRCEKLNKSKRDMTNFYTINYGNELLDGGKLNESIGSKCAAPSGQNDTMEEVKMKRSIGSKRPNVIGSKWPDDLTENTTEITTENKNTFRPEASQPDPQTAEQDFLIRNPDAVVFSAKKRQWGSREDLACAQWIWGRIVMNRPGFPGECFICELRLPDHRFRWKHNKLFLLLPEEYGPAFPAIVDCYTSPPTLVWPVPLLHGFSSSYGVLPPLCKDH
ncbi:hypothetical protein EC110512_C19030 [Escherichia coli O111:H-]|uniref:Replication protein n=1 Tax=Escherichia coli TaxID=562 RepID=A0AB33HW78_ECOLX|nr:phage O protein [Escherichia coli O111:H8 str. F6627]BBF53440.1 replication protein [Escherichia coli]BBL41622.1 hypothetical protein EC110512_C19030 [Escherichia coli O111:H-]